MSAQAEKILLDYLSIKALAVMKVILAQRKCPDLPIGGG